MFAEIKGQRIYYEVFGSGKRILFLHGWGGNCQSFYPVGHGLSRDFQVILLDLPGFGRSELPKRAFGTFDYAEITKDLLEELGIETIAVVGHSFGGRVALALASFGNIVDKLILVDSEGVSAKSLKTKSLIAIYKAAKRSLPSPLTEKLKNIIGSKDYLEAGPMRSTLIKVVNEDLKNLLPKIEVPTLIIWGENDEVTPLRDAKLLSEGIKDSKLEVLPDGSHFSYLDQPEVFRQLIKEFVHDA